MARAATSTSAAQRFDRSRQITAAVLAFVVAVMLIEVVIAPGTMIRRHLRAAPSGTKHDPREDIERARPSLLLNYARLQKLSKEVDSSFADLQSEMSRRFAIDIAALDQTNAAAVIPKNPIAADAWADIRQSVPEIVKDISIGGMVLHGAAARIASGSANENDERDVLDAVARLESARRSLSRMATEIEHIEFGSPMAPSTRANR